MATQIDFTKPVDVLINKEWHRLLGINWLTPEPSLSFRSNCSHSPWFYCCYQSGWPLKKAKFRQAAKK